MSRKRRAAGLTVTSPILHGRPGTPSRRLYEVGEDAPQDLTVGQVERLVRLGCLAEKELGADDFSRLTIRQLRALAAKRNVELPDKAKKDEIVATLEGQEREAA